MKRKMVGVLLVASGLVFINFLMPFQASSAVFPEEGRVIRFIVPNPPGGGMDLYPRTLMPFVKKHLPWKKGEVVVDNVVGAGGVTGSRETYFSKPDGYTIGIMQTRVVIVPQIIGQVAHFDSSRYTFLGQFNNFPAIVFTSSKHPFLKSFSDIKNSTRPITFGMDMAQVGDYWLLKEKMKLNLKPILGFQGSPDIRLAVLKGEVDVAGAEFSSFSDQYKAGELRMLYHYGDKPVKDAPGIPSLIDLGYEEEYAGKITVDRTIIGPPDIPKDRVEILQKAIWAALNDPEFIKICEKSGRLILDARDANSTRESCLKTIRFWTKYGDEIKEEMKRLGYR